jgi:alkyldihydroxyacetonephosphate synthase
MTDAARIGEALGIAVSERAPDRLSYARDLWPRHHLGVREGRLPSSRPAAIAWPESTEQVATLVARCAEAGVRLVPFGAGSGVCGGVLPDERMLVVDLKKMRRWRIDAERGFVEVDAGALGILLEEDLEARGFTVGHFPSSILCSTVGGWVAARGAGQCSGLYGKIEDMVVALECVDGRGERAWLQRRLRGPDLTPLVVGSEGILAVVTRARLRLHPTPRHRSYGAFGFPTMEAGWEAARRIYQAGLRPAVCRLYDPIDAAMARRSASRAGRKKSGGGPGLGGPALRGLLRVPGALNAAIEALGGRSLGGAMLVLVCEGSAARATAELEQARALCSGAEDLGEGPARHWRDHRYAVSYRQAPMFMMGAFVDTMEVAAPWSRLGGLYHAVREALSPRVLVMAHVSHSYPDGASIYFTFAGSAGRDHEAERLYDEAWRAALAAVIEAGGAISHHHGVGRSKAPQMGAELGVGVEIVDAVARALDPERILNPGNLLPPEPPPRRRLAAAPETPIIDESSQTVHASGVHTLAAVERVLRPRGSSLGLGEAAPERETTSVASWIADGAPGAADPWLDPVDHLVAGFDAELAGGPALAVRACPRRAVGPDLLALFFGTGGRAGRIHTAHLRARGAAPEPLTTPLDRDPAMDPDERRWLDRVLDAAAAVR